MECFFCERKLPKNYKLDVCQNCINNGIGKELLQDFLDMDKIINKKLNKNSTTPFVKQGELYPDQI